MPLKQPCLQVEAVKFMKRLERQEYFKGGILADEAAFPFVLHMF